MSKLKCKQCKKYEYKDTCVETNVGNFCGTGCATTWAEAKRDRDRKKRIAKLNKEVKENEKAVRRSHRADKERIKKLSTWLGELQSMVNKYVRLRDAKDGCISCDKPSTWGGQWHASHYYSRGHSSSLRFNLWNIHKSCSACNAHLSGNIGQYTPRLIEKIGQRRFDYLIEHKSEPVKYDIEYIKRAKAICAKAIKRLERRV